MNTDILWAAFTGGIGGLLYYYALYKPRKKLSAQEQRNHDELENKSKDTELKKLRLIDRYSIRGVLLGLGMGIFVTFGQGYTNVGFMIGFSIPFAVIFGLVGLIIDFFKLR